MDYQKMVAFRNEHIPFAKRLGIIVQEIRPGYARVTKTIQADDYNPVNVPHGGCYFSMADTACGSAVSSSNRTGITLDSSYHFLASGKIGDVLTAEAHEIRSGKTICVYEVRITDQDSRLLGTGTFTFYIVKNPNTSSSNFQSTQSSNTLR